MNLNITIIIISIVAGLAVALWLMKRADWKIEEYGGVPTLCGVLTSILCFVILSSIFS